MTRNCNAWRIIVKGDNVLFRKVNVVRTSYYNAQVFYSQILLWNGPATVLRVIEL